MRAKVNQDRTRVHVQPRHAAAGDRRRHGRARGGEIAAQIAVRLFIERFQQEAKPILHNPLKFLQETMLRAHAALGSYANQFSMLETPRTTCVAVIVQGGHAYWAHVGDSRFYLFRQGKLIGSTKDHSKVQYLVDQGIIAPQDVVDASGPQQDLQLPGRPRRSGDRPVAAHAACATATSSSCAPTGCGACIRSARLSTMLTSTPILTTAPQMMREAEERGGADGDNLSAIIVRWGPETLADQPSTTTDTLGLGEFETQIDSTLTLTDRPGIQRDLTDDEIERAIAEIQSTIQKYRK